MEDTKAKHEARRRKILENSEKRLQKITRSFTDSEGTSDENKYKNRVQNIAISSPLITHLNNCSTENVTFDQINADVQDSPINLNSIERDTCNKEATQNLLLRTKFWDKLGFKLTILAICVRLIHIFQFGYLFGETIVIPFALFMLTQLASFEYTNDVTGIAAPIMFFLGVPSNIIRTVLISYNVFTAMLLYFAMYFCSFICTHLTLIVLFNL